MMPADQTVESSDIEMQAVLTPSGAERWCIAESFSTQRHPGEQIEAAGTAADAGVVPQRCAPGPAQMAKWRTALQSAALRHGPSQSASRIRTNQKAHGKVRQRLKKASYIPTSTLPCITLPAVGHREIQIRQFAVETRTDDRTQAHKHLLSCYTLSNWLTGRARYRDRYAIAHLAAQLPQSHFSQVHQAEPLTDPSAKPLRS